MHDLDQTEPINDTQISSDYEREAARFAAEHHRVAPPPGIVKPDIEFDVKGDIESAPIHKVILAFIRALLPGVFQPMLFISALITGALGTCLFGLCLISVVAFQYQGFYASFSAGAVGIALYGQAVAWLIAGEFESFVSMSFVPTQWFIFFVLYIIPIVASLVVMQAVKHYA